MAAEALVSHDLKDEPENCVIPAQGAVTQVKLIAQPDLLDSSRNTRADTWANSIEGDTIVGTASYYNLAGAPNPDPNKPNSWSIQAFVFTVPEPSGASLCALALAILLMRGRRGRR